MTKERSKKFQKTSIIYCHDLKKIPLSWGDKTQYFNRASKYKS